METLQAFFGAYGRVERVWADETRPFVFISYATEDEAMRARTSVEAMQCGTEPGGGDTPILHVMVPGCDVMCDVCASSLTLATSLLQKS